MKFPKPIDPHCSQIVATISRYGIRKLIAPQQFLEGEIVRNNSSTVVSSEVLVTVFLRVKKGFLSGQNGFILDFSFFNSIR